MDETEKEKIALFRYSVIAELVRRPPAPREKEKLLCAIAEKEWSLPGSDRIRIGRCGGKRPHCSGKRCNRSDLAA